MSKLPALEGGSKTRDKFLVFAKPIVEPEAQDSVLDSLNQGWIGTGPKVKIFEENMAAHLSVKNTKALNSCTAALHIAVKALGIGPGDQVLVPSYTFCASANCVLFEGGEPVLVDVDYDTMNINLAAAEQAMNSKVKAIIPVHLAGHPVDMDKVMDFAKKNKIAVIEDAAHAVESKYKGKVTGTMGNIGCYSFYATKNLTTGEGGMITWQDDELSERIVQTSLHGLSADAWKRFSGEGFKHYEVARLGYKYNLTDIQAGLGIAHLKKIYDYLKTREAIWAYYSHEIQARNLPARVPVEIDPSWQDSLHARHLYIIRLELDALKVDRDHILNAMQAEGIGCGIHYKPIHLHKFYQESLDIDNSKLKIATRLSDEILSIPIAQGMSMEDAADVINALEKVLNYCRR